MSLDFTRNRLENAPSRINRFIDENLEDWAREEVLRPTQDSALQVGLSQNALNGMDIVKDGFLKVKMIWVFLGPNDVPLHKFLEQGTSPHEIEALGKLFGGADALHWVDKSGKNIFRKKVRHPGFGGYHLLENGWKNHRENLKRRVIEETNNFLEVNKL